MTEVVPEHAVEFDASQGASPVINCGPCFPLRLSPRLADCYASGRTRFPTMTARNIFDGLNRYDR